jgi:hypothetical protein
MRLIGGTIGAVIGGAIGAAVSSAVELHTGYVYVGVVVGFGALVGLGFRIGSRGLTGPSAAIIAGGIAFIAYMCSLVLTVSWVLDDVYDADSLGIGAIADVVEHERSRTGRHVPPGMAEGEAETIAEFYAPEIWREAQRRYESLPSSERSDIQRCPELADPDWITIYVADELLTEKADAGEDLSVLDWPPHMQSSDDPPLWREDYPPAIWGEAEDRLALLAPAARTRYEADARAWVLATWGMDREELIEQETKRGVLEMFSMLEIVSAFAVVACAAGAAGPKRLGWDDEAEA